MKRVHLFGLITLVAGVHLAAQPGWAQKRGYDGDGRERGEIIRANDKTRLELRYAEFSKAMAWELKTGQEQSDKIQVILKQFRPDRNAPGPEQENSAQTRRLRKEFRLANKAGERERAKELKFQISELERNSVPLAPEMFYLIADVLSEPLLTDYWQIADRFTDYGKVHSGAKFLEFLEGVRLTQEQAVTISLLYKTYLQEIRQAENYLPDLRKAVEDRFQSQLYAGLNETQQAAYRDALKNQDREGERKSREVSGRW